MTGFSKFIQAYKSLAVILLNTVFLAGILYAVFSGVFFIRDNLSKKAHPAPQNYVSRTYGKTLKIAYPHLKEDDLDRLLEESWMRPFQYEPFTQFKEGPLQGVFINVRPEGFRVTRPQGPWPPVPEHYNIFLFGGSTTFNYGLADSQTIATSLQNALRQQYPGRNINVYNFGRGYYYSSQEMILFMRLMAKEYVPDMAVFIDGYNEFIFYQDRPYFSEEFSRYLQNPRQSSLKTVLKNYLAQGPVGRMLRKKAPVKSKAHQEWDNKAYEKAVYQHKEEISQVVMKQYLANKRLIEAIARDFQVTPVFVWQPVAAYRYDLSYSPFPIPILDDVLIRYGYSRMAELARQGVPGPNFLWCADIQAQAKEPLYVDACHYNEKNSRNLAACIVRHVTDQGLLLKIPGQ
ncbi:MAG: hypothetical protein WC450_03280 [Candidatus Omnitrophota bacterium]|jgi:hypothetical protein